MKLGTPKILSLTRRELLRVGGLSLFGGFLNGFKPNDVRAEDKVAPKGTARQVLFVNLEGGMSQVDTLDAKQGAWTPDYFDIRSCPGGLRLPFGLMKNLPQIVDKLAVVRSLGAWDAVHGRAQYYIQTGHPLNLALAKEVPAIGAVVCHELAHERKPSDSLPAFVSMNMTGNQAGLISQGFMSAEFAPLSLSISDAPPQLAPAAGSEESLKRRWQRLQQLDGVLRGGGTGLDRAFTDYHEYYKSAWDIMNDPRVPGIFQINEEDKQRYGKSPIGISLLLARNLFRANAGTRFVLASHGGWDHHSDIYKEGSRNHPVLIGELDAAFASLIQDLESTPSTYSAGRTLLDETLVVCMSEFGRTPGAVTPTRQGREHYIHAHSGMFAGGGIVKDAILGGTDPLGGTITDFGWSAKRAIYMEDVACTIYSALGIDWTKTMRNTPSGRPFHYVEPASGTTYMKFRPVDELFA